MSEVEKQESQKTVVAFITGLLIGGLLVWVFSSTPEAKQETEMNGEKVTKEEVVKPDTSKETPVNTVTPVTKVVTGKGSLSVADQKAGKLVTLGEVEVPAQSGWVVVRDYMDGVPGNVLGAARYSVEEGLMPTSVDLMRGTTVGGSYQVVFFTNEGDIAFKLGEDVVVDGIATTFKAK